MMNAQTGQWITMVEHVKQSVGKIIGTLIGTRLMRRSFGSHFPEMIDSATSEYQLALARAAIVMALVAWEKRLIIKRVNFELAEAEVRIKLHTIIDGQEHLLLYNKQGRSV